MAPPFRRKIPAVTRKVLESRAGIYAGGNSVDYYKPKTRNTAFCTITKNGVTISSREDRFNETYNPGSLKPRPNLISAEIERIGNDASLVNLSMRIRGTIEAYSMADFIKYSEIFCINDPKNELSITMAYAAPFDGCPPYTVSGCFIAYGTWQSTNENYYQMSFEAIGPGEVFSTIDIGISGLWDQNGLTYKNYQSFWKGVETGIVSGYYELMLYDAQKSGAFLTDTIADGEIIGYSRKNAYEGMVIPNFTYLNFRGVPTKHDIVVYQPIEGKTLNADPEDIPSAQTTTDEFYTLQYVVDRIINEFSLYTFYKKYTDTDSKVRDVYVGFAAKPRCSTVSACNPNVVRSCDPKKILILGGGAGNYLSKSDSSKGKNYEKVIGYFDGIKSHYGSYIDYRKILIHRNVVWDALKANMHNVQKPDPSANSKNDFIVEEYLKVDRFLRNLFTVISQCTGGFVQLDLVQDDGNQDTDDLRFHKVLKIVPATFVEEEFDIWKFNTLQGDGSVRELQMTAELPSTDLHASLVKNIFNTSRVSNAVSSGTTIDGLDQNDMDEIATKLLDNYYNDLMPRTMYSEETCDAARNLLASLSRGRSTNSLIENNQYLWLMKMNVKLDGVGGWRIGHHINSNTVPPSFTTDRSIAFVVTRVHHIVESQDWHTELDAICTVVPPGTPTLGYGGGGGTGTGGVKNPTRNIPKPALPSIPKPPPLPRFQDRFRGRLGTIDFPI